MKKVLHFSLAVIGGTLVLAGIITFWLPIPVGLPMIILGLPLVLNYSPRAKNKWLKLIKAYPQTFASLKRILPDTGKPTCKSGSDQTDKPGDRTR